MLYDELLVRLFSARAAGVKLGLERVQRCLDALGTPQARVGARVQIGGTNGKGSTSAFVESIARECGRRTAVFSSPHLSRFAERFRIDGQPADEGAILDAAGAVRAAGGDALTFFEQTTAVAVELFARCEVDISIFEVGLGGRLDATTGIGHDVAAVTGVAIDHESYLGSTIEHIAAEKAGIFRPGQRAVVGISGEPAGRDLLIAAARSARVAHLEVVDLPVSKAWRLGLRGEFQRSNAACAVAIVQQLVAAGALRPDAVAIRRGLERASLAGRLETVAEAPHILVDGAHNPNGARALARELGAIGARPLVVVLAISEGKDVAGIALPLAGVADAMIVTRYTGERALAPEKVAAAVAAVRPDLELVVAPTLRDALGPARARAGAHGLICVAGSLFLAGEAREILCAVEPDAVALMDPH